MAKDKANKDDIKFLKNQLEDHTNWLTETLTILTELYQRPTDPSLRIKVKDYLQTFQIDPTDNSGI